MIFPKGNLSFPKGKMSFPKGIFSFPKGKKVFPKGFFSFPKGKMFFPKGNFIFPKPKMTGRDPSAAFALFARNIPLPDEVVGFKFETPYVVSYGSGLYVPASGKQTGHTFRCCSVEPAAQPLEAQPRRYSVNTGAFVYYRDASLNFIQTRSGRPVWRAAGFPAACRARRAWLRAGCRCSWPRPGFLPASRRFSR